MSRRRPAPAIIRPLRPRPSLAALVAALALLLVACTGGDSDSSDEADERDQDQDQIDEPDSQETATPRPRGELRPTVHLAVTDWTAARLNVAIAEELIERRLGYPVEAVEMVDTEDILLELESGELQALLELWPSSLVGRSREIFEADRVEVIGELGVVGRSGWYVPRYAMERFPELSSWEALESPSVAAEFATAETGNLGRFLGTDPGYEQYDEELIDALGLPFEVVYSGSDAATAAELERASAAGEPVLLFWWTPTPEITRFDLARMALPTRTPDCDQERPRGCDYPEDRVLKIASPGLAELAPEVADFLAAFKLDNADQMAMIDQVDNRGQPLERVAGEWIEANEDRWRTWFQ